MAIKKCEICGEEFVDYGRGKYCPGPHYKICTMCGNKFEYDCRAQHIPVTCSRSCASKLAKLNTSLHTKICPVCNKEFKPSVGFQKFCSVECRVKSTLD